MTGTTIRTYNTYMTQVPDCVSEFNLGQKKVVQEAEVDTEARPVKEVDFHHMEEVVEVEVEVEAEAMMVTKVDVLYAQVVEVVRGHPSIPLLPLSLTVSICIPHSSYTYPTTPRPLRPSCDHRHSSSIYRYSTIQPTWSQPRLMPHNYHRPQWSNVT
jgi:hypothetical protein